ncbi:hypothetical protein JYU34_011566 [Plutella xylostella]|uniref:DUF5641 domain-containing protein n=1 Tax=Plutella xylostella TaxID=51655 RepID=A0ABQ7QI42_PLUXY|nr:hypothetical protein JYU34_011566 [Plutella xylostella]
MFINQYLNALKERTQIRHKQPRVVSQSKPKVGDVVQIKGDNNNRSTWKIGKIILLHRGRDNEVRVATVKVGDKEYIRSIAHLFPLEIEEKREEHEHIEKEHVSTRTESDCREETETLRTTQETEMEGRSIDMPTEIETVEPTTDQRSNSRAAARRAKEKIAQWTKELVNLICVNCIQL